MILGLLGYPLSQFLIRQRVTVGLFANWSDDIQPITNHIQSASIRPKKLPQYEIADEIYQNLK